MVLMNDLISCVMVRHGTCKQTYFYILKFKSFFFFFVCFLFRLPLVCKILNSDTPKLVHTGYKTFFSNLIVFISFLITLFYIFIFLIDDKRCDAFIARFINSTMAFWWSSFKQKFWTVCFILFGKTFFKKIKKYFCCSNHLPPHAVNVFVPLTDLTLKKGPTEFVAGNLIMFLIFLYEQKFEI